MAQDNSLYRIVDETGQLLYVGISVDPGKRLAQHRSDKPWWSEVVTVHIQPMPTRKAALEAERAAIKNERPKYNVVHNEVNSDVISVLAKVLSRIACLDDRAEPTFNELDLAYVEELLGGQGSRLSKSVIKVLAGVVHRGNEIPELYTGLTELIASFTTEEVQVAQKAALERASKFEDGPPGEARVLQLMASELARMNKASAPLPFETPADSKDWAPF